MPILLAFISLKSLDSETGENGVDMDLTRRVKQVWKAENCSLEVECLVCDEDDKFTSPIDRDESIFPVTFAWESAQQHAKVSLAIHRESRRMVAIQHLNPIRSASTRTSCPFTIRVLVQEKWLHDPFRDLPQELISHIFALMVHTNDTDLVLRGSSAIISHLQHLRLVNTIFARIGLSTIAQVLGTVKHNRLSVLGAVKAGTTRIDPLKLFDIYPRVSATFLRQLVVKDPLAFSSSAAWRILSRIFHLCEKLEWVCLLVKPPRKRRNRERVLHHLVSHPSLKELQLSSLRAHGEERWEATDLAFLLKSVIPFSEIKLEGWDLQQRDIDFSQSVNQIHLTEFMMRACKVHFETLQAFLPFVIPGKQNEDNLPTFHFWFSSFWHDLVRVEELLPYIAQSANTIHTLYCDFRPHTKAEAEENERSIAIPAYFDEFFLPFHNMRVLVIDGGASSSLVSPDFLYRLDCPYLEEIQLHWVFLNPSSITYFLAGRDKYASSKGEPFCFAYISFYADINWTPAEFTEQLRLVDDPESAKTAALCQWEGAKEGVLLYQGKNFEFCWTDAPPEAEHPQLRWWG